MYRCFDEATSRVGAKKKVHFATIHMRDDNLLRDVETKSFAGPRER